MVELQGRVETFYEGFLKIGQRFVNRLGEGYVFGIVTGVEKLWPITYDRFLDQAALSSQARKIGDSAVADWHFLRNSNTDDIFFEEDQNKMLHAFIGIAPADLRIWYQFPTPIISGNLYRDKAVNFDRETKGYIDGNEDGSPYALPTSRFELMIPKELDVNVRILNPLNRTVRPILKLMIQRYTVKYYNPDQPKQKAIIDQMVARHIPARWWSPHVQKIEYDVRDKIRVRPLPIAWEA